MVEYKALGEAIYIHQDLKRTPDADYTFINISIQPYISLTYQENCLYNCDLNLVRTSLMQVIESIRSQEDT